MKIIQLNSLLAVGFALFLSSTAHAAFTNPHYDLLARALNQSITAVPGNSNPLRIREINAGFAALPRGDAPIEDLREMKFLIQYWRLKTSKEIITALNEQGQPEQFVALLNDLRELGITLSSKTLSPLINHPTVLHHQDARDALFALLASQGQGPALDRLASSAGSVSKNALALAGPRITVPIFPLEPSEYPFEKWSKNKEFSRYSYPDANSRNTIQYRGMTLKSGDFILMNENDMTDADFTSLGKDRAYVSHFGIVAILEKDGLRFPVGIEMHTNGLRAVPLSRFISRDFAAYVEIYRLRGMTEEWREKINTIGLQELKNPKGYDFQSQDANRRYLNCVTVGSMFLERSGIRPIEGQTVVREKIRDDFVKLGLLYDHLLTPTDVARSPRVDFVGTIDQNMYAELLARDLTAGELVQIFNEGTVAFWKAPPMYYLLRFGVNQIQNKTFIGKWILKWKKMDAVNLPNAPSKLLSWVVPFENRYRKMVREVVPMLIPKIMALPPSLHGIQASSEIRKILDEHSSQLRALFSQ